MRAVALLATGLLVLGAGCANPEPPIQSVEARDQMRVAGLVESETFNPLANATVGIAELNLTVQTNSMGQFSFPPLEPKVYLVEAGLQGYRTLALVARPETNPGSLDFVLQRALAAQPRQDRLHFQGSLDCAYVAPSTAGSCDTGLGVFANQTRFEFPVANGWKTIVVDALFDPQANPGFDGLQIAVQGHDPGHPPGDAPMGQFNGSRPFTIRLEPGSPPQEGRPPVPANLTRVTLQASPVGHLEGQPCTPPAPCSKGAGAGTNLHFDLYVTLFYVTPAPAGYTLRNTE